MCILHALSRCIRPAREHCKTRSVGNSRTALLMITLNMRDPFLFMNSHQILSVHCYKGTDFFQISRDGISVYHFSVLYYFLRVLDQMSRTMGGDNGRYDITYTNPHGNLTGYVFFFYILAFTKFHQSNLWRRLLRAIIHSDLWGLDALMYNLIVYHYSILAALVALNSLDTTILAGKLVLDVLWTQRYSFLLLFL